MAPLVLEHRQHSSMPDVSKVRLGEDMTPEGRTIRERWCWRQVPGWVSHQWRQQDLGESQVCSLRGGLSLSWLPCVTWQYRASCSHPLTLGLRTGSVTRGFCSEWGVGQG